MRLYYAALVLKIKGWQYNNGRQYDGLEYKSRAEAEKILELNEIRKIG
jgi:hypothetical protein